MEKKGQQIYFTGESPSGRPIEAFFGAARVPISGSLAVCSSCHGYDGLGRPESGIDPTNITWNHLTKSYGHIHNGTKHPPFSETSLRKFLLGGTYPGGKSASPDMPLYLMAEEDLAALVAFLKKLGTLRDPGLDEDVIRIGTILPSAEPMAGKADLAEKALRNSFGQVNRSGGIFGRQIELSVYRFGYGQNSIAGLRTWLSENNLFALVSPFVPGYEVHFQEVVALLDIPVVGPFTLYPPLGFRENRQTFSLQPGVYSQMLALQVYVAKSKLVSAPKVAMLYQASDENKKVFEGLAEQWRVTPWKLLFNEALPSSPEKLGERLSQLKREGVEVVVYAGLADQLKYLMNYMASVKWSPLILAPGSLAGDVLLSGPKEVANRLVLAYPSLARDRRPEVLAELNRVIGGAGGDLANIQVLVSAYVSMKLTAEILRQSGRDLDRRKFIAALEKTYKYDSGLMPPITFTRNRRVGTDGIYVVRRSSIGPGGEPDIQADWFVSEVRN